MLVYHQTAQQFETHALLFETASTATIPNKQRVDAGEDTASSYDKNQLQNEAHRVTHP